MKRQQAFIEKNKMLKGGLHTHTTRSDGKTTPEETIRYFKDCGYDFLALTDHRFYNYTNYAPDIDITIIPGMEMDNGAGIKGKYGGRRCFHTVCIGPTKEDGNGFEQDEKMDSAVAPTQEEYQKYLDDIHAKNNLTVYCHPEWSSTPARYFDKMQGDFAMEIWNSGVAIDKDMDKDAAYWDELLGQGKLIYGVATDDGHRMDHHCNGWVMVNAENNINAILKALKEGKFYSSCGPEIYDFYMEDNKVIVECSPVVKIRLNTDGWPSFLKKSEDGSMIRAEFMMNQDIKFPYFRATVIDKDGKYAWTNPIFINKDLIK